ncbi:hypothetical protein K438DRAFT_1753540 [Mycena galopus ATCC 62051]|nr:hypothetical protein K438DRAFT_1753540 [Mycena galopus ATCC 62051]
MSLPRLRTFLPPNMLFVSRSCLGTRVPPSAYSHLGVKPSVTWSVTSLVRFGSTKPRPKSNWAPGDAQLGRFHSAATLLQSQLPLTWVPCRMNPTNTFLETEYGLKGARALLANVDHRAILLKCGGHHYMLQHSYGAVSRITAPRNIKDIVKALENDPVKLKLESLSVPPDLRDAGISSRDLPDNWVGVPNEFPARARMVGLLRGRYGLELSHPLLSSFWRDELLVKCEAIYYLVYGNDPDLWRVSAPLDLTGIVQALNNARTLEKTPVERIVQSPGLRAAGILRRDFPSGWEDMLPEFTVPPPLAPSLREKYGVELSHALLVNAQRSEMLIECRGLYYLFRRNDGLWRINAPQDLPGILQALNDPTSLETTPVEKIVVAPAFRDAGISRRDFPDGWEDPLDNSTVSPDFPHTLKLRYGMELSQILLVNTEQNSILVECEKAYYLFNDNNDFWRVIAPRDLKDIVHVLNDPTRLEKAKVEKLLAPALRDAGVSSQDIPDGWQDSPHWAFPPDPEFVLSYGVKLTQGLLINPELNAALMQCNFGMYYLEAGDDIWRITWPRDLKNIVRMLNEPTWLGKVQVNDDKAIDTSPCAGILRHVKEIIVTAEDRLLVVIRAIRKAGFPTIGSFLAAMFEERHNKHESVYQSIAAFLNTTEGQIAHHPVAIINLIFHHTKSQRWTDKKVQEPSFSLPRHALRPTLRLRSTLIPPGSNSTRNALINWALNIVLERVDKEADLLIRPTHGFVRLPKTPGWSWDMVLTLWSMLKSQETIATVAPAIFAIATTVAVNTRTRDKLGKAAVAANLPADPDPSLASSSTSQMASIATELPFASAAPDPEESRSAGNEEPEVESDGDEEEDSFTQASLLAAKIGQRDPWQFLLLFDSVNKMQRAWQHTLRHKDELKSGTASTVIELEDVPPGALRSEPLIEKIKAKARLNLTVKQLRDDIDWPHIRGIGAGTVMQIWLKYLPSISHHRAAVENHFTITHAKHPLRLRKSKIHTMRVTNIDESTTVSAANVLYGKQEHHAD